MQGGTEVVLTVVDALGYLDELKICVGYEYEGKILEDFPVTAVLEKCSPVYETLPGWKCDIRGIRKFEELPENCRNYILRIEELIDAKITMVSNGPGREDIILR